MPAAANSAVPTAILCGAAVPTAAFSIPAPASLSWTPSSSYSSNASSIPTPTAPRLPPVVSGASMAAITAAAAVCPTVREQRVPQHKCTASVGATAAAALGCSSSYRAVS
eukprot:scaffold199361_cov19-Tisochrysis_lutea.AAC.3